MGNSSLLTIVLTLKDRSPFTYRWMNWMNESKCPYKILIADGGKDKDVENYLKNYENYPHLNYEYIRYPYDENKEIYYYKWNNVINKVITPYIMLADNDDFVILDYINEKIDFLETDMSYSCYLGDIISFDLLAKDKDVLCYSENINFIHYRSIKTVDIENTYDRTMYMLKKGYAPIWYSIMRTEYAKIISNEVCNAKQNIMQTSEYNMFITLGILGKVMVDSKPHYVRQLHTSQSAATTFEGYDNIILKLLSENWQKDYMKLREDIFIRMKKIDINIKKDKFYQDFNIAYEEHISSYVQQNICVKNKAVKFKTYIMRNLFLSKIIITVQNILKKNISPLISQNYHKEPTVNKVVKFINKNAK